MRTDTLALPPRGCSLTSASGALSQQLRRCTDEMKKKWSGKRRSTKRLFPHDLELEVKISLAKSMAILHWWRHASQRDFVSKKVVLIFMCLCLQMLNTCCNSFVCCM